MNPDQVKLGIAPIGWTNDDLPELGGEITFEQCVSEMALAGYTGCEVGNKFPKDPTVLKKYLDIRGLQVCNHWFCYELTTNSFEENQRNFEQLLDFLEVMGTTIIGGGETGSSCQCQPVPVFAGKGMLQGDSEWKDFASKLNALGKIAQDRGITLAFHHHMGTVVQSLEETLRLLDMTDPECVQLNYDCGHFTFAGEDPVAALEQVLPRVAHVHLKDVRPAVLQRVHDEDMNFLTAVKNGVFTVPGDPVGCIDFPSIFQLLETHNYTGWLVVEAEQDPAQANPFEYALMARNYLREQIGT